MLRASFTTLVCAILICTSSRATAQTPSSPDSALQVILNELRGTPLRLQDAIQAGVKNTTSVRIAEAALIAAGGSVRREAGTFDPQLFFNLNYQDQRFPTASFFAGAPILATQQTTSQTGVRVDLPIGTRLELSVNTVKLNTNSAFAFLNPEYDAFGTLSLRQPLLGGFTASARKNLSRTEQAHEAEQARYDQAVLGVSSDVERTYWDLYAAERDYAVQRLTRDRAEAFLKEAEVRAQTGLVGPNDVVSARTFLSQQSLLLVDREEQLDRQSDQLASLIGERPGSGVQRFIPNDEPSTDYPSDSIDALVEYALKSNLDLQAAKKDVDAAQVLANAAKWEALPSVNLVGSLGGSGLTGSPQDVIFNGDTLRTTVSGSFGNAISQVGKRDFPNWSVGVEVNVPIGLRRGLGEKERLDAEVLRAQQRYIEQSRALEEQVRSAYRELIHGKSRLEAARAGVDAAQEQVRIGMIEFHNGRSTAFELVRLGEDLAVAQRSYSDALVRTAKAAATLKQLTSGGYPSTTNK